MTLAKPAAWNADPDADGEAPLCRDDHVARITPHLCVPRNGKGKIADYLRCNGFDMSGKTNFSLIKKLVSTI